MSATFGAKRHEAETAALLGMTVDEFRGRHTPWKGKPQPPPQRSPRTALPEPSPGAAVPSYGRSGVYARDLGLCRYCGVTVERSGLRMFTIDHLVPRCRGGRSDLGNLVTACWSCNQIKGDRSLDASGLTLHPIGYRRVAGEVAA